MFGKYNSVLVGLVGQPKTQPIVDSERLVNQGEGVKSNGVATVRSRNAEHVVRPPTPEGVCASHIHSNEWRLMSLGDYICLRKHDTA